MLLVYLLLVFKYDRAWNHPFTVKPAIESVINSTDPYLEVKSGTVDRYGQNRVLDGDRDDVVRRVVRTMEGKREGRLSRAVAEGESGRVG